MASSGSFNTSAYNGRYLTFAWTEQSQSIADNKTTISWTLKGAGGSTTNYYISGNFRVVIAGTTVYSSSSRIELFNGTTVASGTFTLTHNSDGTKSFTASAQAGIYTVAVNCSGSGTFTLDTIARKSTLSANNGTLGTAQALTVTRQANSLTHTITYKCGSATGTVCTKSSNTSINWTPPLSLAKQNTTGTSVAITFTITTYSGNTDIGSNTTSITCNMPSSIKPSCTFVWDDVTGMDNTYGYPVQGLSKIKINVSATISYGSAIASYLISANGASYTTAEATTGVLRNSGSMTITATVTDKRGRKGTYSDTITVRGYSPPHISSLAVRRCNSDGTANDQGDYIQAVFSASITPLDNQNIANYTLRYRPSGESSYTEIQLTALDNVYTVENYTHVFLADGNSSFDVGVVAQDNHNTDVRNTSASTAFTLMNWGNDGKSMGIGKVAEETDTLEVALNVHFYKNTSFENAASVLSSLGLPVTYGTWTPKLIASGGGMTYTTSYSYAYYYRIGDLVYITLYMKVNVTAAGTNYARIQGLPFTPRSGFYYALARAMFATGSYNNNTDGASAFISTATNTIHIQSANGTGALKWRTGDTWVGWSGCYIKA